MALFSLHTVSDEIQAVCLPLKAAADLGVDEMVTPTGWGKVAGKMIHVALLLQLSEVKQWTFYLLHFSLASR